LPQERHAIDKVLLVGISHSSLRLRRVHSSGNVGGSRNPRDHCSSVGAYFSLLDGPLPIWQAEVEHINTDASSRPADQTSARQAVKIGGRRMEHAWHSRTVNRPPAVSSSHRAEGRVPILRKLRVNCNQFGEEVEVSWTHCRRFTGWRNHWLRPFSQARLWRYQKRMHIAFSWCQHSCPAYTKSVTEWFPMQRSLAILLTRLEKEHREIFNRIP